MGLVRKLLFNGGLLFFLITFAMEEPHYKQPKTLIDLAMKVLIKSIEKDTSLNENILDSVYSHNLSSKFIDVLYGLLVFKKSQYFNSCPETVANRSNISIVPECDITTCLRTSIIPIIDDKTPNNNYLKKTGSGVVSIADHNGFLKFRSRACIQYGKRGLSPQFSPDDSMVVGISDSDNQKIVIIDVNAGRYETVDVLSSVICWTFLDSKKIMLRKSNELMILEQKNSWVPESVFKKFDLFSYPISPDCRDIEAISPREVICVDLSRKNFVLIRNDESKGLWGLAESIKTNHAIRDYRLLKNRRLICTSEMDSTSHSKLTLYPIDRPSEWGISIIENLKNPFIGEVSPDENYIICALSKNPESVVVVSLRNRSPEPLCIIPIPSMQFITHIVWNRRALLVAASDSNDMLTQVALRDRFDCDEGRMRMIYEASEYFSKKEKKLSDKLIDNNNNNNA